MFIHFLVTFCCIALSTRLPTIITEIITEIPNTLYNKIVLATSTVLVASYYGEDDLSVIIADDCLHVVTRVV
jgi:hypothetical protein